MAVKLYGKEVELESLQVRPIGWQYGPPQDRIDSEVIITVRGEPQNAYGFQLRKDDNEKTHAGMLDLLRDAFNNDWTVYVEYNIDYEAGKKNGTIVLVGLRKKPMPAMS